MPGMRVEETAEALATAFLAVKRHLEREESLKAGLYEASRTRKPSVNALRLARKILHIYAVEEPRISKFLENALRGEEVEWDAEVLLKLLAAAFSSGLELGEPEKIVMELRRNLKKFWPESVEPWIGLTRSIAYGVAEVSEAERYPRWFVKMLRVILGRGEAERLMRFQDENKPRTYVVLNKLLKPAEKILEEAEKAGIELNPDRRLPGIYVLEKAADTRALTRLVRKGLLLIQDFSSYYAVFAADPKPGETVLDLCAAPGTKTILMGISMLNNGLIISMDSSIQRIRTHLKRVRRAGLKIVEEIAADATADLPLRIQADLVLLDPPCSSTGLFWREPTYRRSIKPRHVRMFARLQAKMIESAAGHVKKGGRLIYSTCSVSLEENELLIEDFLKRHPEFELSRIEPELGSDGLRGLRKARRLYPHRDLCNGFFVAKLTKKW
ncbi:MAG: RsmB/NOP family class I SAM-dependent RNA methyltransferase [Thaumarchaeota archaeon]|nr:RsmB/NOP family class I SAM-dependent RNA methyltransferase [Nitrososphaerota archaeon]